MSLEDHIRDEFEITAIKLWPSLDMYWEDGEYASPTTHHMWQAWVAAAHMYRQSEVEDDAQKNT